MFPLFLCFCIDLYLFETTVRYNQSLYLKLVKN